MTLDELATYIESIPADIPHSLSLSSPMYQELLNKFADPNKTLGGYGLDGFQDRRLSGVPVYEAKYLAAEWWIEHHRWKDVLCCGDGTRISMNDIR